MKLWNLREVFNPANLYHWQVAVTALLLVALFSSFFLLSLSMIALLLISFLTTASNLLPDQKNISGFLITYFFRGHQHNRSKGLYPALFLPVTLIFWLILVSGLWSSDLDYWAERVRIALPFLALPFTFFNLPVLQSRAFKSLALLFILSSIVMSAGSLAVFYLNPATDDDILGQGGSVPVPIHHIRFGLLLCVAALLSAWFAFFRRIELKPRLRTLFLFLWLITVCLIHLLAVRSALAGLYLGMLVMLICLVRQSGSIKVAVLVLITLPVIALSGYFAFPGMRLKANYTAMQIPMILRGELKGLSDGERLASIHAGLASVREAPLAGHGYGDIRNVTEQHYNRLYPELSPKLPHNQWVFWAVGFGIIGAVVAGLVMLFPAAFYPARADGLIWPFFSLIVLSCLVESTFETAHGVALYTFFTFWFIRSAAPD